MNSCTGVTSSLLTSVNGSRWASELLAFPFEEARPTIVEEHTSNYSTWKYMETNWRLLFFAGINILNKSILTWNNNTLHNIIDKLYTFRFYVYPFLTLLKAKFHQGIKVNAHNKSNAEDANISWQQMPTTVERTAFLFQHQIC